MRAIIQRVTKASVTVGDSVISSIGKGLCVLVGISRDDNHKDIEYIVRKILNTRVFDDDNDKRWAKNVMDKQLEVLCVSQFTLYHILKGNKPDFHSALGGDEAKKFYEEFLRQMGTAYKPECIKDGLFGAEMQVHIQNDGPVTITLESPPQQVKKDPRMQKGAKAKPKGESQNEGKQTKNSSCDARSGNTESGACNTESGAGNTESSASNTESGAGPQIELKEGDLCEEIKQKLDVEESKS